MRDFTFVNELAQIMKGASQEAADGVVNLPVIGTLDGALNLNVDGFGKPIPAADYHVWEPRVNLFTTPGPLYDTFAQDYRVELFLKPGDRVICMPIEDGHTFMVMGHVKGGMVP